MKQEIAKFLGVLGVVLVVVGVAIHGDARVLAIFFGTIILFFTLVLAAIHSIRSGSAS